MRLPTRQNGVENHDKVYLYELSFIELVWLCPHDYT